MLIEHLNTGRLGEEMKLSGKKSILHWLESNVQIMLCHSTHSNSRIFVPWMSLVALNASVQVQLAYWGLSHSFGGLAGKNMRNRQAGEGPEAV